MGPTVAVEVAPPPSNAAPELTALLRACSQALPVGRCEARGDVASTDEAGAFAEVVWRDESSVRIEVRLLSFERGMLTRELSFGESDEKLERWRSVGLTIATIVDELSEQQKVQQEESPTERIEEPPPTATPPPPAPVSPAILEKEAPRIAAPLEHSESPPRPIAFGSLEAGGLFGTGLASGQFRAGLYARAAHDSGALPLFADVSVGYALLASSDEPEVTWTELTLGGGVRFSGPVRLELGVAALLERVSASAREPDTGAFDTRGSWLPGAALSGRLAWPSETSISVVAGARGAWIMREVVVTNAGGEVARIPAYNVSAVGGVRLNF